MPISREEFEAGRIDLAFPVRRVLEDNPGAARTAEEVRDLLAQIQARNASVEDVAVALRRLVEQGYVETNEVEDFPGVLWYIIRERRIGFRGR